MNANFQKGVEEVLGQLAVEVTHSSECETSGATRGCDGRLSAVDYAGSA